MNLIHFDVAGMFILAIALCMNVSTKMKHNCASASYLLLIASAIIAGCFSIGIVILEGQGSTNDALLYTFRIFYSILHYSAIPFYIMYLISVTRLWQKFYRKPLLCVCFVLPFIVTTVLIATTPITKLCFTYENGIYTVSEYAFVTYIAVLFYLVLGIVLFISHYKLFSLKRNFVILLSVPIMFLSGVLEIFFPNSTTEVFAKAVNIMFVAALVQNPEISVDSITSLRKFTVFASDMKMDYLSGTHSNVICLNTANFESLNAILGYDSVNKLLRKIAKNLNDLNEKYKTHAEIYYLDRGNFRVVIGDLFLSKSVSLAEEIYSVCNERININGIEVVPDIFVCVADCPGDIKDYKTLMAFGMDFHKNVERKEGIYLASELFKHREFHLLNEIDTIIEKAFEKNNFHVYYQPIYSVSKKKFVSAEALLRLRDDEFGLVPPKLFIPAAERSGAIHKIGEFVFNEVCKFITDDNFVTLGIDYIRVNLSTAQCMQVGLAENVMNTLNKYKIEPSMINFEITETTTDYNQAILAENMNKLSQFGVRFSLDDFGVGYSNILKISSLPFNTVKLDKALVDNGGEMKYNLFIEDTIKLLKNMKMEVVAEGVETEATASVFSDFKCDYIQGFFYSKPIPKADFIDFIRASLES